MDCMRNPREEHPWTQMLWSGMEPRLHGQVTAAYDFNTYLTVMMHAGTPFGKLEYSAAAALYGRIFLIHGDGEQTLGFGNANETYHFWLRNGHI